MLKSDFYGTIGLSGMWDSEQAMKDDAAKAKWLACVFAWCSVNLLIAIFRTIITNPGNIPEDIEWDMPNQEEEAEEEKAAVNLSQHYLNPNLSPRIPGSHREE